MASDAHRAIEAVWRIESARLIAGLARMVGDVGVAEDLAQDALVAALEQWPASGVPDNPGAWLMTTAKRRGIDQLRRKQMLERKHAELGTELEARQETAPDLDAAIDDQIGDDLLSLIFTACHPVLTTEARTALTLRLLGGLTTEEIARAFLVPTATISSVRSPAGPTSAPAWPRCSRSSTSSSMRATRPPPATSGYDPRCAKTRSGSAGSWRSWFRRSRRSTAWSR